MPPKLCPARVPMGAPMRPDPPGGNRPQSPRYGIFQAWEVTLRSCQLPPSLWDGVRVGVGGGCYPDTSLEKGLCDRVGETGCRLSSQPVPSPQQKQTRLPTCWAQPFSHPGGILPLLPVLFQEPGQQLPIWMLGRAAAPGNVQRESGGSPRFGRKRGGLGGGAGCRAGGQGQVPRGGAWMALKL